MKTNQAACTVAGKTNDATSSPCTVTIKLNSGSAEAVIVNEDGTFSKALTLAAGTNTITVVATDKAGKQATVTRTVILDTTAPRITDVVLTPNPVDAGKTFIISVTVTVPADLDGTYIVELTAWDDAGNYCFVLKWLLMFDPSSLCAHLIPCPYQAEVVPPLFYAELLQPACGRR